MRYLAIGAIGAASMVGAWLAFALVFTDESPFAAVVGDAGWILVPGVVIAGGVLAAIVGRGPSAYPTVVVGGCTTVVGFAALYALTSGPQSEPLAFAAIGVGLAITMLTIGFVPTAVIRRFLDRRQSHPGSTP